MEEPMTEPLLLSYFSDVSKRTAIVADEGDSVWLYLTEPETQRPERDCWLLNTTTAPASPDFARYREQGQPPPAPASIIDPDGVRTTPAPDRWSVRWSTDGEAVAVALDGNPIGFVRSSEQRGCARFLLRASPWGSPWDQDAASRI
jgi:hypothetical protein